MSDVNIHQVMIESRVASGMVVMSEPFAGSFLGRYIRMIASMLMERERKRKRYVGQNTN